MRAISAIVAGAILAAPSVLAGPPPETAGAGPVAVQAPPAPPDLAPLSRDFQAAMANSQLQTYRYNQLTEQALALRKLCETGFGPADICPKAAREVGAEAGDQTPEGLPTIAEINGVRGALSAVLVFSDGRRLTVRPGSVLPGGLTVAAITQDDIRVATPAGRQERLPFGDREPAK